MNTVKQHAIDWMVEHCILNREKDPSDRNLYPVDVAFLKELRGKAEIFGHWRVGIKQLVDNKK